LTLTGRTREERFGAVLLFRSRYLAPATHSARFYREYFRPVAEQVVEKDRKRWLVAYRGVEFYVHLDQLRQPPAEGWFVEVKSRTWSRRDARDKAAIIAEHLLALFGASTTPCPDRFSKVLTLARRYPYVFRSERSSPGHHPKRVATCAPGPLLHRR
jgi:hypothetical protein